MVEMSLYMRTVVDNIDEVINIIRSSKNTQEAKDRLMERFALTDVQAQAIVDMRLRALTGLEREKLENEYAELMERITELKAILADKKKLLGVIREEILLIADKYGDDRRTSIGFDEYDISMEDLIPVTNTVITMTKLGYIKRMSLDNFRVTNRADISEKLRFLIKTTGSGLAPFDSWLILRGIKTLGIRMEQAQKNAFKIAEWLKTKSAVIRVIYPGLQEHPGYEIMKKQARGFGSMLTFQLESKEFALSVLEKVRMIKFAESLGGVETLITYPTTQTHADVPKEIRERNGITEATLRLSVGIEDAQDLLDEFEKVFAETEEELYGGKKS